MCEFITAAMTALAAGGTAATAAGATATAATAATAGSTLATIGTVLSIGGSVVGAVQSYKTAKANAEAIEAQAAQEAQLNAVQDQRTRLQFMSKIAQQRAEIAGRGVALDSPTAIYLGQSAAAEMAFESQAIRSGGQARQQELTAESRQVRAAGQLGLLRGGMAVAGSYLNNRAEQWQELAG